MMELVDSIGGMWPFAVMANALAERRLRREALEEILTALDRNGVPRSDCFLTGTDPHPRIHSSGPYDSPDYYGMSSNARRTLEGLIRNGTSHEMCVSLATIREMLTANAYCATGYRPYRRDLVYPAEERSFAIGKTRNPAHGTELAAHEARLRELERQGTIGKQPDHEEIADMISAELKPKAFACWKKVTVAEWESQGNVCPACNGHKGSTVEEGSYDLGPHDEWFDCVTCRGTGSADAATRREYFRPKGPVYEDKYYWTTRNADRKWNSKVAELQKADPTLLWPTESSVVYLSIVCATTPVKHNA